MDEDLVERLMAQAAAAVTPELQREQAESVAAEVLRARAASERLAWIVAESPLGG